MEGSNIEFYLFPVTGLKYIASLMYTNKKRRGDTWLEITATLWNSQKTFFGGNPSILSDAGGVYYLHA